MNGNKQSSQDEIGEETYNYFKSLFKSKDNEDILTQLQVIKEIPRFFSMKKVISWEDKSPFRSWNILLRSCLRTKVLGPMGGPRSYFTISLICWGRTFLQSLRNQGLLALSVVPLMQLLWLSFQKNPSMFPSVTLGL
jgi:hypothetical protein